MGFNPSYIFQEMFSRMSLIAIPVSSFKNISFPKKALTNIQVLIISMYDQNSTEESPCDIICFVT